MLVYVIARSTEFFSLEDKGVIPPSTAVYICIGY